MSVLTAIFQSIAQAIFWIFPLSESGHSALFHNFSNRLIGTGSSLTGVVHIGIAIGIIIAMYNLFFGLIKEFFSTFSDLFKKQLKTKPTNPRRSFMYMTIISFAPMLLWLIPTGHGFLFSVLRKTCYNSSLVEDGLFLALTGLLVFVASDMLSKPSKNNNVTWIPALVIGVANVFLVPVSGMSLIGGVFAILILFGVAKKLSLRYPFVISVPVLVVMGIVEICTASIVSSVVQCIIGLVLSILASFACVKTFIWLVKSVKLKFFGIYDITIGVIVFFIGIIKLIIH